MAESAVKYLVFDVESVADGALIAKVRYPLDKLSPGEAIQKYTEELVAKFGTEFIPYTYHIPVSIAVIKINAAFEIVDIVTLDDPDYRPAEIARKFWEGWRAYRFPQIITFNGRSFDLPLMELAAFRYGISVPEWFNIYGKSWEQKRARYNPASHMDLQDVLTNFGASRLNGGLNLVANLVGSPGKMGVAGHMVQSLHDEGRIVEINDYCRCDVLDTYFVFLRTSVIIGEISIDRERELVAQTREWLTERCEDFPVYGEYLKECYEWENPWPGAD